MKKMKSILLSLIFVTLPVSAQEAIRVAEFGNGFISVTDSRLTVSDSLAQFFIDYDTSDRHIRDVGILKNGRNRINAFLADADGREDIGFSAHYRSINNTLMMSQTFRCRGFCRVVLPGLRPGRHFALTGFRFQKVGAGDHHLKSIGIMPHTDGRRIDVHFKDNAAFDYEVTVQYLVINDSQVSSVATVSGDEIDRSQPALAGTKILSGFSLYFATYDRHVQKLGVNVLNDSVRIDFQDNNIRTPIGWQVRYIVLD
jgi:hypothetical protein